MKGYVFMQLRTDLAVEAREIAGENVGGVEYKSYRENGLEISRLTVKNQKAKRALGKEIGTYITIELPSLTDNFTETDERLVTIGAEIRRLLPETDLCLWRDSAMRKLRLIRWDRKRAEKFLPHAIFRRNCQKYRT